MRTDELIADLAGRLTPVRPLPSPGRRAMAWAAGALLLVLIAILLLRPRPDISDRLADLNFMWTLGVAGLVGWLAAVAALILAVPGAETSSALRSSTWFLVVTWGLGLGVATASDGSVIAGDVHWPACFSRVVAVGLVPATVLGLMIRRAAALRPRLTGLLAMVAAMALSTIAVQIACPLDAAGHSLPGHFGPVMAMGAIGAVTGHRWLTRA